MYSCTRRHLCHTGLDVFPLLTHHAHKGENLTKKKEIEPYGETEMLRCKARTLWEGGERGGEQRKGTNKACTK